MIDFCRSFERTHGTLPKLLVFDQKLTTQEHLAELDDIGVEFITLRQRSPALIADRASPHCRNRVALRACRSRPAGLSLWNAGRTLLWAGGLFRSAPRKWLSAASARKG